MFFKNVILLASLAVFQSCMLPGKMNKAVSSYYITNNISRAIDNTNGFIIHDTAQKINGYCQSKINTFYTVPLLVYTFSRESMTCKVNKNIYTNAIVKELNNKIASDSVGWEFNKKTLDLSFENVPNTFGHKYTSHFFFFQLIVNVYFSFVKNEMYSPMGNIKIKYIIKDKTSLLPIKEGYLEETVSNIYLKNERGRSRKKFIKDFVTSYDRSMTEHCKNISQKLIKEL